MATSFSQWPVILVTFLMVSSLLTSARDIPQGDILIVKEPENNYYIVKRSPVVIVCQAKNAAEIIFSCMGTQIPPTSVETKDVSDIDPDLIEAQIEVTRADVQNHEGSTPFWCECSAVAIDGQVAVTSKKGFVSFASFKNKFQTQPKSTAVTVGDDVEFACGAPEAEPKPEIVWRKDKKRLEVENNPRLMVTDEGSLVIESVILEDKGMYQCIARNVAGRRESEDAQLTVIALAESAEPVLEISEEGDSGKKTSGIGKPRATRQSIKTYFTTEPQEKYYVTDGKILLIDCGVVAADILTFRCNGKRMNRTLQTINQGLDTSGNRVIQSQLSISYADVIAFQTEFGEDKPYQCLCSAWYQDSGSPNGWGRLDSNKLHGLIHLAYLDEVFQIEPSDVTGRLNSDAVLVCEPPKGQPSPWVYWYKDGNRLDPRSSGKYSVIAQSQLTVHNAQFEDVGLYNCLAENSVRSVQSKAGRLTVSADVVITTTPASDEDVPTFPAVIPSTPLFLRDFEAEYSLGADGTKTLVCAVVSADQMTIDCGGQRLAAEEYKLTSEVHSNTGKRLLYATAVITSEKMARNPDDFFCQCTAWYLSENKWNTIMSSKGYVRPAAVTDATYIEDTFVAAPEDTDAYFESEAAFTCQPPLGNPTPQVHWLKDGVRIDSEADPNFVILDDGKLFIEYVRITDEGEYICVAENEAGSRESQPIQFTVLGKPVTEIEATTEQVDEPESTSPETEVIDEEDTTTFQLTEPVISKDLDSNYYIANGEEVTLLCSVIAAKALVFVCNGEVLKETATTGFNVIDPHTMQSYRENTLIITKDQVEARRVLLESYTCLCRAYYQKEGGLPTEYLSLESSSAVIEITYLDDVFLLEPSETKVTYLGNVELLCRPPEGNPAAKVSWQKDDSPVIESDRIRVEDSGTLIIERFEEDDEGSYTCVANNTFSSRASQSAFVSLTVTGVSEQVTRPYSKPVETDEPQPETTPSVGETLYSGNPYISKDLHSVYYLAKNKPATITCEAYSVEYISFICGMQTVSGQETREKIEDLSLPDGQSNFVQVVEATINVSKSEVENYQPGKDYWCQCYAYYRVPGVEELHKLTSEKGFVEIAYLKKTFQKEPESQNVMEGNSLTILCQPPIGNPAPKVTWTKNGEDIEALSITPSGVLIIPEAQLEHAGEYICVAENEAAKRMSPPVIVEVKPKEGVLPSKGDTEKNVDEAETEDSEAHFVESDVDSDADGKTKVITESSLNRATEQSFNNEISEEIQEGNLVEEADENVKITEWQINERGQEQHSHERKNVDSEMTHETGNDNKDEHYEGGIIKMENNNEEYVGSDKSQDTPRSQDENYDRKYDTKDNDIVEDYQGRDKTMHKNEDGNKNGIWRRKSNEGNECAQMLTSCSNLLPRNMNHLVFCAAVPVYTACVDNYFKKCTGIINEVSMNAVKMAYMDTQKKCTLQQQCPQLEECKTISSNSLDNSMDSSGLSVHSLCTDTASFLQCVDQNLAVCNVTMSSPEEDVRASLFEIGNWFTQYCNRLVLNSMSLEQCTEINSCDLQIGKVVADNNTYWCSLISSLVDCTNSAIIACDLDELVIDLDYLDSQAKDKYCSGDGVIPVPSLPKITPEPEDSIESNSVEPEPTGEKQTDKPDFEDGDNGDESNENKKGGAEGKVKGDDTDDDDKHFENNAGNEDFEDTQIEDEDIFIIEESENKFNKHTGSYEENSIEDNFIDRDDMNSAKIEEEDQYAARDRLDVKYDKPEEEDDESIDGNQKTLTENEVPFNQDGDGDQEEIKSYVGEASKEDPGNGSGVLGTSILLAAILQLLTVVSLSWR